MTDLALPAGVTLRDAVPGDEGLVDHFVRQLAIYEKMEHLAEGTPEMFARALFSSPPRVWAMIVEHEGTPIGLALYYAVEAAERLALPWHVSMRGRDLPLGT